MKKFELLKNDTITFDGRQLYRIKALENIFTEDIEVHAGTLGGYVESEDNLSHNGACWIFPNGIVYGKSLVSEDAIIENGIICDSNIYYKTYINNYRVINSNIGTYCHIHSIYFNSIIENCDISGVVEIHDCGTVRNATIKNHVCIYNSSINGYFDKEIDISSSESEDHKLIVIQNMHVHGYANINNHNDYGLISGLGLKSPLSFYYSNKFGILVSSLFLPIEHEGINHAKFCSLNEYKWSEEYNKLPVHTQNNLINLIESALIPNPIVAN